MTLLSVSGLSKRFGATQALDSVDFNLNAGEIHSLLGENGAGKSTLIKILAGVYKADAGKIEVSGVAVDPRHNSFSIAFIHQDLALVETMTVAENIAIVASYTSDHGPLVSWKSARAAALSALGRLGSAIDPDAIVADLPAAERSLVAIARALAKDAAIIVLDEPTAALPEPDVARLLDVLKQLSRQQVAIIYVTHRIDEVFRISDHVTVLRDGRVVGSQPTGRTSPAELVQMIVGRSLSELFVEPSEPRQSAILKVDGLRASGVGPISFSLHEGEVLGLAGLRGAGHLSVGRAIYGLIPREAGTIEFMGRPHGLRSPAEAIAAGMGLVPNKRREEGLANGLTITENVFINPAAKGTGFFALTGHREEREQCQVRLAQLSVRPPEPALLVSSLSGGNQQKVVLARWFAIGVKVLILEEPTIGVDVGAKAEVYRLISQSLSSGNAVLLISSDFEEVAGVSNRVLVFDRGKVVEEIRRPLLSISTITSIASGGGSATTH